MGDEHNFAMPPADEPILMGPPPTEDDAVFVGDVDTTGGAVEDTAAVMVPAPEDAGAEPVEDIIPEAAPVEPTGPTPMSIWNDEWQISLNLRPPRLRSASTLGPATPSSIAPPTGARGVSSTRRQHATCSILGAWAATGW